MHLMRMGDGVHILELHGTFVNNCFFLTFNAFYGNLAKKFVFFFLSVCLFVSCVGSHRSTMFNISVNLKVVLTFGCGQFDWMDGICTLWYGRMGFVITFESNLKWRVNFFLSGPESSISIGRVSYFVVLSL